MRVSIPATCGAPYTIRKSGRLYTLIRIGVDGRKSAIVMGKADAIAITNQLIDLIEQDTNHDRANRLFNFKGAVVTSLS